MGYNLDIRKLKAANLFTSKDKTRYYLNGVLFEASGEAINLVATDGHRLIKFTQEEANAETFRHIIHSALIEKIKVSSKVTECEVSFETGDNGVAVSISYNGATYRQEAVDEVFPDYNRVIPTLPEDDKRETVLAVGFNASYLGDFAKVNKTLGLGGSYAYAPLIPKQSVNDMLTDCR